MTSVCFHDDFILHEINFLQFLSYLKKIIIITKAFYVSKMTLAFRNNFKPFFVYTFYYSRSQSPSFILFTRPFVERVVLGIDWLNV